jgi:hypothetical protein
MDKAFGDDAVVTCPEQNLARGASNLETVLKAVHQYML